jgi:hypothetical protein
MNNSSSDSEVLARATATRSAQAFLRFARFPITRVDPSPPGYRVTFMDFRFYRPATATALGSEVLLDQSLSVVEENLSFVQRITSGE